MVVFRPIRFLLFTHTLHLVSSCLLFEMLGETQVYLHTAPLSLKLTTPGAFVAENLTQKTSQTFPPLRVSAGRWRYDGNNFWLLDSVQAWCRRAWLNERNYAAVGNLSSLPQASLTWPWLHNYYVYLILTLRAPPECPPAPHVCEIWNWEQQIFFFSRRSYNRSHLRSKSLRVLLIFSQMP